LELITLLAVSAEQKFNNIANISSIHFIKLVFKK
jgi:hypothetical protein